MGKALEKPRLTKIVTIHVFRVKCYNNNAWHCCWFLNLLSKKKKKNNAKIRVQNLIKKSNAASMRVLIVCWPGVCLEVRLDVGPIVDWAKWLVEIRGDLYRIWFYSFWSGPLCTLHYAKHSVASRCKGDQQVPMTSLDCRSKYDLDHSGQREISLANFNGITPSGVEY